MAISTIGLICMELNIKLILTVTVIFIEDTIQMYHVQFVMSLNILQSVCSLPSTLVLVDGPENTTGI